MNGMMEYKGCRTKVEHSPEDDAFIGKVFGIADTLVFERQSIEELQTTFHASIDDDSDLCQEVGKTPDQGVPGDVQRPGAA